MAGQGERGIVGRGGSSHVRRGHYSIRRGVQLVQVGDGPVLGCASASCVRWIVGGEGLGERVGRANSSWCEMSRDGRRGQPASDFGHGACIISLLQLTIREG